MGAYHNVYDKLVNATDFPVASTGGAFHTLPGTAGVLDAYGTTVPSAVSGYSPGCIFRKTNGNSVITNLYVNTGSAASCTFTPVGGDVAANGLTIATAKTLAVTDADKLTVGGLIVPQHLELTYPVYLHASQVIHNVFTARRAYTVTNISYITDIAQAVTATVVKSTVNATPASGTTPMHTANSIDANTTIHNATNVTLTATGADLALAATDKIGIVLNTALTTGKFTVNISLKRV